MVDVDNETFLGELARGMPGGERLLTTSVAGDPEEAGGEMWRVRPWPRPGPRMNPNANNYACVSSFRDGPEGFRRRAEQFGAGLAFMIDDVGTKVPLEVVDRAPPTALIETSPHNWQAWYFLSRPVLSYDEFTAALRAFVDRWAGGRDPGMGGPNRVGRLPEGVNGKRKYGGFVVRAARWEPERRWTLGEIAAALDFQITAWHAPRRRAPPSGMTEEEMMLAAAGFAALVAECERHEMFLKRAFGRNGRRPILCPWHEDHTGGARTGTYLTEPNEKNGWQGSFVCYHSGTHQDANRLGDLRRYVDELEEGRLRRALARANSVDLYANTFNPTQDDSK
jgi:hypothetical protein